ncbi:CPYA [Candida oxycetoniae]|uniref:Carboxypeptidase n=1 Tax=Candida oxycetoniae TaxID=497107 RepID=A0AAI9T197_9ASCO|nr:CPYA [Candida oxycetoniae]KAI3407033.1 CPYA [Candida oxycetoniae]
MRVNTFVTILTFTSIIQASDKQVVFNNENDSEQAKSTSSSVLDNFFDQIGKDTPELLVHAWADMQKNLSPGTIAKLVRQYDEKKAKPGTQNLQLEPQLSNEFEVLTNKKFTDYSLRIKTTNPEALGLDTVNQYTGYIDVQSIDHHYFFWFFESRNDPQNDPVVLWLNGGPGCSDATGLFFELGPSSINSTLQPVHNPYSWNSNASVIFLDQPVGVGYSYSGGDRVTNTATAAKDVFVFLELFFQKFDQFRNNKFHIAGESYAGHYIPKFASEILSNSDRSFELSSVLIGNGITDPLIQAGAYKPMACGEGGYKPVLTEDQCDQMERDYPKCAKLAKLCYKFQNAFTCVPTGYYCETKLFQPYAKTGLNPYDIRKPCAEEGGNCYIEMNYIDDYLNLDYVKQTVGASNIDIFTACDDSVFRDFLLEGDEYKPFQQYVAELLDKDIPVLIYAGDKDYICNWLGNFMWVNKLQYKDGEAFANQPLKPWIPKRLATSDETKTAGGEVKNYNHFTFLRIYDAGHMVPYDQPENALLMLNSWIQGDYSLSNRAR